MLSMDILLGVFCSYLFAASLLKSDAPSLVPVILCIAVWLLYTLDHLADAHHLGERAIKPVYKWHWKNRRLLFPAAALLFAAGFFLSVVFLPARTIYAGLAGGGILRYLYKEVWVGLIYTAGVWGLPFLFRGVQPDLSHVFLVPAFLCIVLVNVLSYSWFEFPADSREKLQTLAVWHGTKICGILIRVLLIITVILVITGLYFFHSEPERIIAFVILIVLF